MYKKQSRIKRAPEIEKVKYKDHLRNLRAKEAIDELEKLYSRYPDDKTVIFDLASLYIQQDINFKRGQFLFTLIRDRKNSYSIDFELGKYYLRKKEYEKAKSYFNNLLDGFTATRCKGLLNLVIIDISEGKYKDALDKYTELLKVSEDSKFTIPHGQHILYFLLHMNKKSGKEFEGKYNPYDYYATQVNNYSAEAAIGFIKKDTDPDSAQKAINSNSYSIIYKNIDIAELYKTCDDAIQLMEPAGCSGSGDYYLVPVGFVAGESMIHTESSLVEVLTIPNTKSILSIHPTTENHIRVKHDEDLDIKVKRFANNDIELPFIC